MTKVEQIKKAFHKARIAGEQKLSRGEITWEQYAFQMIGFELSNSRIQRGSNWVSDGL